MRKWKWLLTLLCLAALACLYVDERRFVKRSRPRGFSTDMSAGSTFAVRLQRRLDLRAVDVGQTIRFVPADALPYGSTNDARLPAGAVLEARVRNVMSYPRGHRVVVFEFERVRAGGRAAPLSAFLTVTKSAGNESAESRRDMGGSLGAVVGRSVQDNPLAVLVGYLSGTYFGDFWSRRIDAPASFFSDESGQTVSPSFELRIQLHRRAFIPR
jgi:hypothetical protein